jgi:hypothetical protein
METAIVPHRTILDALTPIPETTLTSASLIMLMELSRLGVKQPMVGSLSLLMMKVISILLRDPCTAVSVLCFVVTLS